MKKYLKVILMLFVCLSICFSCSLPIFADLGGSFDPNNIASDPNATPVFTNQFDKIWSTAINIIRIAAFSGIIFLGVIYMCANADKKADLKKSLVPVLIGIVIVFGSTLVIDFVKNVFTQLSGT